MTDFDINLSTQPFPAYRIVNLVLTGILIALVSVSAWQAYGFMRFSSLAQEIRNNDRNVRVEHEALGKHLTELESRLDRPEAAAKLNEIGFLNRLIARKELSWTRMFANFEDMVPDNVRLVSLTPNIDPMGAIVLHLAVRGRSIEDVSQLIKRMEQSPVFEKVIVSVEEKTDASVSTDVQVMLTANYYPQKEKR